MTGWLVLPDKPYAVATAHLPDEALQGLNDWQRVTIDGKPVTIVPHDYGSWRLLRDQGLMVPAPTSRFSWPGPKSPMDHQKATTDFLIRHEKAFCLNGLRTGKTVNTLWAAEYLMQQGVIKRVLIVCPKFLMDIIWERELFTTLPHRRRALLTGTRKRKQEIAQDTRIDYIVVNPESLHLVVGCLKDVDLVVVDEFTTFKSVWVAGRMSQRYQALKTASKNRMLWMLSGTPNPQYPTDAYGPIRLVNPRYITLTAFRDMTMMKVGERRYVPRIGSQRIVAEWLQPSIRFKREDCIDIPEVETGDAECSLTPQQSKTIESLVQHMRASIAEGEEVAAVHRASVLLKILQVMAGGVYGDDPDGERPTYRVKAEPYLETVESVVREDDGPVIVFVSFQCSVDVLADYLESKGYKVGRLTRSRAIMCGKKVKTMQLFDAFHARGELDVIVAVPQTMKYGLELTRCHTVLWASPPFSYETYEQANARVTGASQTRKVMILHLIQNNQARELFNRLLHREAYQTSVLDLIELFSDV